MRKVHFSPPSEPQKKAIRRRVHRYWICRKTTVDGLMPWTRWCEESAIKLTEISQDRALYVLDIIDNKVIKTTTNLRDLFIVRTRRWPLKERMLEVMADRQNGKKSRRKLAALAKEMA